MRKIIGVIAPYISQEFLASIMDQIHALARERGAEVMLFEGDSHVIGPSTVAHDRVDGWILFLNSGGATDFIRSGKPVIAMSSTGCEELCPVILPDNWG